MTRNAVKHRARVTVMLGNSLTDRDTLAVLELLRPDTPAEVVGLYIEDSELLSLADIPVVREYCRLTQVERRLQAVELERQFRTQARLAERALAAIANPRGYLWSFRSLRGDPVALLREALAGVDLLLLGATSMTLPVALRTVPSRRPVMALFNGTESSERALRIATRLAEAGGTGLTVVLNAARDAEVASLRRQAGALAGERPADFLEFTAEDTLQLLNRLRRQPAGQLVLGIPAGGIDDEVISMLRSRSPCPVILVR